MPTSLFENYAEMSDSCCCLCKFLVNNSEIISANVNNSLSNFSKQTYTLFVNFNHLKYLENAGLSSES